MNINVQRLHPAAKLPEYATDGSGCFDLFSTSAARLAPPFNKVSLPTGLAFEIPKGFVMLVFSRSGHGRNHCVRLANCVGVIDSDYRGEVQVRLHQDDANGPFFVEPGDRIAQALVIPFPRIAFTPVNQLSTTQRGTGGFGSTGA